MNRRLCGGPRGRKVVEKFERAKKADAFHVWGEFECQKKPPSQSAHFWSLKLLTLHFFESFRISELCCVASVVPTTKMCPTRSRKANSLFRKKVNRLDRRQIPVVSSYFEWFYSFVNYIDGLQAQNRKNLRRVCPAFDVHPAPLCMRLKENQSHTSGGTITADHNLKFPLPFYPLKNTVCFWGIEESSTVCWR